MDQNCAYCMEGDLVAAFGIKICELPTSKVYLFKEQSHTGRVIVAHKQHVSEITELTAEERAAYMEDINHVAEAIQKANVQDKIQTRLQNGLASLPNDVESIVIAGMGSETIVSILTNDLEYAKNIKQSCLYGTEESCDASESAERISGTKPPISPAHRERCHHREPVPEDCHHECRRIQGIYS